jgi:hypothetical protein
MYKLPIEKSEKQSEHMRTSKTGKVFSAGSGAKPSVSRLIDIDIIAFASTGAKSGGQIRTNPQMKAQYTKIIKQNLGKPKAQLTQDIHDELENENFHLLNEVLAQNGYYVENIAKRYRISE